MAVRLRKTIKLGNNARLNISKSGVSVTAGVKGLSVNTGPNGTYLNAGIPGTGLSSRTRLGGPAKSKNNSSTNAKKAQAPSTSQQSANMPDPAQAAQWSEMKSMTDQATYDVVNIHRLAPIVTTYQSVADGLNALEYQPFIRQAFPRQEPTQDEIEAELWKQAQLNVKSVLSKQKKQQEYFAANYQAFWQAYMNQWLVERDEFEKTQSEAEYNYNAQKRWFERMLANDSEIIENDIEEWLQALVLPVEMSAQIEYEPMSATLLIDLDLPEVEDIPTSVADVLKSGEVKLREKTQKQVRDDYAQCIFGLAVFIAACAFNINVCIKTIVVSGYTQRRDKIGDLQDEYIYSVRIPRNILENVIVTEPETFIRSCENRINYTSTYVFKTIVPFEL